MLAYFSLISDQSGSFTASQGSLVKLPPELCDSHRINRYKEIQLDGWSVTEFGYLAFKMTDEMGKSYILPGLYLEDGPKPTKRFYGYKPQNKKEMVEVYLRHHIARAREQMKIAEESTTALVHDLRHLSSAIYHSAEQAGRAFADENSAELAESLKTIVATQTMLKARIDYLDYTTGVDRFETSDNIPVFSRVDKVVRCFRASANDRQIELDLSGESYRFTKGPNILDIVPYTLVDNAIKYSPVGGRVQVKVFDREAATFVSVTSEGPPIRTGETAKIFESGFRGENATALRPSGTGIGLSVAKEILEKFSGDISVSQSGIVATVGGIDYQNTVFTFSVPSFGKDKARMKRFARKKRRSFQGA